MTPAVQQSRPPTRGAWKRPPAAKPEPSPKGLLAAPLWAFVLYRKLRHERLRRPQ